MNETLLAQFDEHWASFTASLRGNLSRITKLSFPAAELALEEARIDWIARDTVYGRWFLKLEKENQQIAQVVERILTKDMHFTECKDSPLPPELLQYVIPAAGAGVSGVAYHFLAQPATMFKTVAVPVVAAGVLFFAAKGVTENMSRIRMQKKLDVYMDQLTIYRDSVMAALKA